MTLLRFIISVLYSIAGVSGCAAFVFLQNYPAAILAIATGIINIVASHIHFLNYKNKLLDWYTSEHLRQISCLGFYSFAFSTSVLIYFSIVEIMEKRPILPIEDSAVIPMIWCLITLKSGLILFYFGRSYSGQEHTLLAEEPLQEESDEHRTEVIEP